MKKIPSILTILSLIFLSIPISSIAKVPEKVDRTVTVTARVGEFNLNVSGIIAPYASLSIVSGGNVYKSTTADNKGNFSFSDILINRGFSEFCIDAVDWRRFGESYTCFTTPPAKANITMTNVFLPPTLGLDHREVPEGSDVLISGYSMPNSSVSIHINDSIVLGTSDSTGYYSHKYENIKAGSYRLYAGASYDGRTSLEPYRKIVLSVMTLAEYWTKLMQSLIGWILSHLYFFVIPSLILLILLIIFIIYREPILIKLHLRQKKLHHAWMVGY